MIDLIVVMIKIFYEKGKSGRDFLWKKISGSASTRGGLLQGSHGNRRIVFSQVFFLSLVMEMWDCRHLFCFLHLLKFLVVSLILAGRFSVIEVKRKELVTVTSVNILFVQNFKNL